MHYCRTSFLALLLLVAGLFSSGDARGDVPAKAPPPVYGPEPAAAASDVEKLRVELRAASEQMASQQEELKALKARLDAEAARAEVASKAQAEATASLPTTVEEQVRKFLTTNPTVAAIRGGLTLSGFVQGDLQFRQSSSDQLNASSGQPLNDDRFLLRRARLRLTADYGVVGAAIEFDGNTVSGTVARLIGAEASVRWPAPGPGALPYVALTTGLFKTPFGFEVLQSDKDRLFMERSTVMRALFPGEYDLGIRVAGGWRFLRYAVAAMDGDPIGERAFPGRDPNGSKDFLGRVGVDVAVSERIRLVAGVSGLYGTGFSRGVAATKDVLVWRDLNEDGLVQPSELSGVQGSAATISTNFSRFGLGGDLQLTVDVPHLGPWMLYGELIVAQNLDRGLVPSDPVASSRDLRQSGWYVGAALDLTKWGQIGVRYDFYNPDGDSSDRQKGMVVPSDQSYSTFALVGAVRYNALARLSLEYDINRNHLGRDASGRPVNLADNVLLLRGQVVF